MKLVKMSLLAATLITSSAFAIDNVKVSGDARLYYEAVGSTEENGIAPGQDLEHDLFDQQSSNGQVALNLGLTADLMENVSAGVSLTLTDTLGLEQNLVGGTWAGPIAGAGVTRALAAYLPGNYATQWWVSEAWVAGTLGKTTAKVGRQYLDTPLAFSEKWNIASNSFTAAVLLNQDIPDTTLVAAYVGQGNGDYTTVGMADSSTSPFEGYSARNNVIDVVGNELGVNLGGQAGGNGAYAVGAVNNSWKPLTVQAWYYNVVNAVDAGWVQADLAMDMGLLVGAQYAVIMPKDNIRFGGGTGKVDVASLDVENSTAMSLMAGWSFGDVATVKAAFSQTADDGLLNIQNTATGDRSKLYTEAWWNRGVVGLPGTTAFTLAGNGEIGDVLGWFAQYSNYATDTDWSSTAVAADPSEDKAQELALGVDKSFGALDTSIAYIHTDADFASDGSGLMQAVSGAAGDYTDDRLQVYLTLNF